MSKSIQIAIDGNEANVSNRVGSNVYAFELLKALELQLRDMSHSVTVLLSQPALIDLPKKRKGWSYKVFGPKKFWTQWALPMHLWFHRYAYNVLLTPGHYAPRFSPIPYISSVMDTAYLEYPDQFNTHDRVQLEHWTRYSVNKAARVIAISEFTKQSIVNHYKVDKKKISVIYPAAQPSETSLSSEQKAAFFSEFHIQQPYTLFVGTLQPRKNILTIIDAFEQFSRKVASNNLKMKQRNSSKHTKNLPKLVLAGKVGWLADSIMKRIEKSPFKSRIILPGFVTDEEKKSLYQSALCTVLVGIHEGFGIPPLEAMIYGSVPVVADATSLPEVVGKAGYIVKPFDSGELSNTFLKISELSKKDLAILRKKGREQSSKFSWEKSANELLRIILEVAT